VNPTLATQNCPGWGTRSTQIESATASPWLEYKEGCRYQAQSGGGVIPSKLGSEIEHGEDGEDAESDDFLYHLQLNGAEAFRADPVGRNLQAVFKESDAPAYEDHFPQSVLAVLQVSVPGNCHAYIRENEQYHCPHIS
jgi:hypothetical protein